MNYCIAVFKSRSATLAFARLLRAHNIPCAIVNTPNRIGHACGISVKFLNEYMVKARDLVNSRLNISFSGFYSYNDYMKI